MTSYPSSDPSDAFSTFKSLHTFWDLEKTVLHEICASGTVLIPLLTPKSPTCLHKPKTVVVETVLVIFV